MFKSEAEAKAAFSEAFSHFEALEAHIMGMARDEGAIVCTRIKSAFSEIHLEFFGHRHGEPEPTDRPIPPRRIEESEVDRLVAEAEARGHAALPTESKTHPDGTTATDPAPLPNDSPVEVEHHPV